MKYEKIFKTPKLLELKKLLRVFEIQTLVAQRCTTLLQRISRDLPQELDLAVSLLEKRAEYAVNYTTIQQAE